MMPDANNITVITALLSCDNTTLDINRTTYDLRDFYQNNVSNLAARFFSNVSIINYNCTTGIGNYFEQILTFTQSVSIRIQILFASIYFDYINANNYQLNGFIISREVYLNLSSITTNNSATSDACSSADVAQDPLCQRNSVCTILSNRWNYTCSQNLLTTSLIVSTTNNDNLLERTVTSTGLNSWQLGLVCSLSVLIVLLLILLSGYLYRRFTHSKQLALSHVNLYDVKSMQKNGIPQGQAFQRAKTIVQPTSSNHTAISWINDGTSTTTDRNDENYINLKLPGPSNQVTFVDHAKVHDPDLSKQPIISINVPTNPLNRKVPSVVSRSMSRTSMNQLKLITGTENSVNESDHVLLDRSILNNPKQSNSILANQFTNVSFLDENLSDEDAWMSILDVVNAELAILDQQDRISTLM